MKISISDPELHAIFSEASIEELAPFANILASKIRKYRKKQNGLVPPELFLAWLGIAGVYYCCDILVRTKGDSYSFWLKQRSNSEINPAMVGKYQIVGSIGVYGQSAESVLARSLAEIFGDKFELIDYYINRAPLSLIGAEVHQEPWRNCTCLSLLFELEVEDTLNFVGEWMNFKNPTDPRIVRHQQESLQWRLSQTFRSGRFVTLPGSPD